jgi:hypothetical protein
MGQMVSHVSGKCLDLFGKMSCLSSKKDASCANRPVKQLSLSKHGQRGTQHGRYGDVVCMRVRCAINHVRQRPWARLCSETKDGGAICARVCVFCPPSVGPCAMRLDASRKPDEAIGLARPRRGPGRQRKESRAFASSPCIQRGILQAQQAETAPSTTVCMYGLVRGGSGRVAVLFKKRNKACRDSRLEMEERMLRLRGRSWLL